LVQFSILRALETEDKKTLEFLLQKTLDPLNEVKIDPYLAYGNCRRKKERNYVSLISGDE
jgi:hypothetical protein